MQAAGIKSELKPVDHSTDVMGATLLVALLFASVFSATSSLSKNTQCSSVAAQVWTAVRSKTHISLWCLWNNSGTIVGFEDVDVTIEWDNVTNETSVAGDGIVFTIHDYRNVRNALLNISLPPDHRRILAEGTYYCGCKGFNQRGAQKLIGE